MRKFFSALAAGAALLFSVPALAANCPTHPYNLANGSTADATQVMADFNNLLNCLNNSILPSASPAFTGTMTGPNLNLSGTLGVTGYTTLFGGTTASGSGLTVSSAPEYITGAAGTNRSLLIQTAGSNRWAVYGSVDAESGGNAGTLLNIGRYSDAGAFIDVPFGINRATGMVTMVDGLTVSGGGLTVSSGATALAAGTTTVPPLKLPAGSLLTAPVAGAVEADGTNVYYTQTSGPTRKTFDYTDGSNVNAASFVPAIAATGAQAKAGTSTSTVLTPANFVAAGQSLSASCGTNCTGGYVTLPGGLIMEWGHYDSGGNNWTGGATVTFPLTFPTGCLSFVGMTDNQGGAASPEYALQSTSACGTTSIGVSAVGYQSAGANSIRGFYWVAYGR